MVDKKERREEGRENLRRERHRLCVCMSRKGWADQRPQVHGKPSLRISQLDCRCSHGRLGWGGHLGVPAPLPGGEAAGNAAPRSPPPFSGCPCSRPYAAFSKALGCTGPLKAPCIQQGLHKCCMDTWVLARALTDLTCGFEQDCSPPGPWLPPLSSKGTRWVVAKERSGSDSPGVWNSRGHQLNVIQ